MATDWTQFTPVNENGAGAKPDEKKSGVDWDQFTPVEKPGLLRSAGDTGLSIARGLAAGTQMVADSFGANNAVSKVAGKIADGLGELKSDQSKWKTQAGTQRMDAAEATGSGLNEFVAGATNFFDQPLDMAAEGLGSSIPTIAAIAATRGKVNPLAMGAGAGAVQGAGSVKGQIYGDVKQRHIAAGKTEAEADALAQQAQAYTGENTDQIALGAGLGAVAGTSGAEGAVSRIIGQTSKSGLKPIIANVAAEGSTEFAQGGQEKLASNIASQREGFDAPTWQGVVGQGTMEGLAGAGSGAAFGVAEAMAGGPAPVQFDPNAGALSKALAQHPDTVAAPVIPPPAAPLDPATTGQANYSSVVMQSDPMALDKAQNIAAAMNYDAQGGDSYTVAPHGDAGFTVVPTAWMTDEQLTSFASVQGDGGRLPAPAAEAPPAIRVDANGNAMTETPEQVAEVEAMKQRYIDMGKPTPRGVNPNDTIQKAAEKGPAIAAGLLPQPELTASPAAVVPATDGATQSKVMVQNVVFDENGRSGYLNVTDRQGTNIGHVNVLNDGDGTAHIFDVQFGEFTADGSISATQGKGYGTDLYIAIGKQLAAKGIRLQSTQWNKHLTAVSPAALKLWAKLERSGHAKQVGTVEGKVLDRGTGAESVQQVPVYEFVAAPVAQLPQREDGTSTFVPDTGMTIIHGSNSANMTAADVQIFRGGQKQGKKGRSYGGFYGTSEADIAQAQQ
ncbi:MAG: hypothetical protein WA085_12700, partial [Sphingobium sp.]